MAFSCGSCRCKECGDYVCDGCMDCRGVGNSGCPYFVEKTAEQIAESEAWAKEAKAHNDRVFAWMRGEIDHV